MNRELEKASLRESLALRRAEEVEREHKQDMFFFRGLSEGNFKISGNVARSWLDEGTQFVTVTC